MSGGDSIPTGHGPVTFKGWAWARRGAVRPPQKYWGHGAPEQGWGLHSIFVSLGVPGFLSLCRIYVLVSIPLRRATCFEELSTRLWVSSKTTPER